MIKLKYTEIAQALDLEKIEEEIKRLSDLLTECYDEIERLTDLKEEIENYLDEENKKHYDFEYEKISISLKFGHHIRAFYNTIEPTYILYYKTDKLMHITSQCFNRLIPNLEHRPSGRPCEECYVWKD